MGLGGVLCGIGCQGGNGNGNGGEVQDPVISKSLSTPPVSPSGGDRYIVAATATGDWTGREDDIAEWSGAAWLFTSPTLGMFVYVNDETEYYSWNGAAWVLDSFHSHATTHELGGTDELDVSGLTGIAPKVIKVGDDVKAILEAASAGDAFYLERGTHTLAAQIVLTDKVRLQISGPVGAVIKRTGSNDILRFNGGEDVVLEGVTFDGDGAGVGNLLSVFNSGGAKDKPTRFTFRGLTLTASGAGAATGIYIDEDYIDSVIVDSWMHGNILQGMRIPKFSPAEVTNCLIRDNIITTTAASPTHGITIENRNGEGVEIAGNLIRGAFTYGIRLGQNQLFKNALVTDNIIDGGVDFGISVDAGGQTLIVSGNHIDGANTEGIQFANNVSCKCDGNWIRQSGSHGIDGASVDKCSFNGNHIITSSGYGIDLSAALDCSVQDNYFDNNTSGGVRLGTSSARCLLDGNKYRAGGPPHTIEGSGHTIADQVTNSLVTNDAIAQTIATLAIPDDVAVWIEVEFEARRTNAAGRAKFKRGAYVYREGGGAATIEGSAWTPLTIPAATPYDATIAVSGNDALIRVTGDTGHDVNWQATHTIAVRS